MGGMGRQRRTPADDTVIPDYLKLFEEDDMKKMWLYMQDRYHLSPKWKQQFDKELLQTPKHLPVLEFFFQFLLKNINPILNQLVYTGQYDVTVFKIAKHLIQSKIDLKLEEENYQRNLYRNGYKQRPKI